MRFVFVKFYGIKKNWQGKKSWKITIKTSNKICMIMILTLIWKKYKKYKDLIKDVEIGLEEYIKNQDIITKNEMINKEDNNMSVELLVILEMKKKRTL